MTVAERVRDIVAEYLGVPPAKVTEEATFLDDLGADELERIEMVMACEEAFGFLATDESIESVRTVAELVGLCGREAKEEPRV